jgi:hypothetical protein
MGSDLKAYFHAEYDGGEMVFYDRVGDQSW